ncbi:hypothetical protein NBRC116587_37260 [Pseudoteredinibacter isoporae]
MNKSKAAHSRNRIKPLFVASAALLGSVLAVSANASGSFGPAGFGPKDQYNLGKVVYHKKVSCSSCPSPSKGLNKSSASELIDSLKSSSRQNAYLKSKEKKAVIYYLKKRYKIR